MNIPWLWTVTSSSRNVAAKDCGCSRQLRGGSVGRAFAQAILADWATKKSRTCSPVDYLVAAHRDAERLAIGLELRGILTDYTIATDRDSRLRSAAPAAPISYRLMDDHTSFNTATNSCPCATPAVAEGVVSVFHADRIHTPTLFLGGSRTSNVPISGSEQMYRRSDLGCRRGSWSIRPAHVLTRRARQDLAEQMSTWLDRYVPPPPQRIAP